MGGVPLVAFFCPYYGPDSAVAERYFEAEGAAGFEAGDIDELPLSPAAPAVEGGR